MARTPYDALIPSAFEGYGPFAGPPMGGPNVSSGAPKLGNPPQPLTPPGGKDAAVVEGPYATGYAALAGKLPRLFPATDANGNVLRNAAGGIAFPCAINGPDKLYTNEGALVYVKDDYGNRWMMARDGWDFSAVKIAGSLAQAGALTKDSTATSSSPGNDLTDKLYNDLTESLLRSNDWEVGEYTPWSIVDGVLLTPQLPDPMDAAHYEGSYYTPICTNVPCTFMGLPTGTPWDGKFFLTVNMWTRTAVFAGIPAGMVDDFNLFFFEAATTSGIAAAASGLGLGLALAGFPIGLAVGGIAGAIVGNITGALGAATKLDGVLAAAQSQVQASAPVTLGADVGGGIAAVKKKVALLAGRGAGAAPAPAAAAPTMELAGPSVATETPTTGPAVSAAQAKANATRKAGQGGTSALVGTAKATAATSAADQAVLKLIGDGALTAAGIPAAAVAAAPLLASGGAPGPGWTTPATSVAAPAINAPTAPVGPSPALILIALVVLYFLAEGE